tara:strand:- start:30 stop:431 length:402 start_codon:yes stop_codon:yes gene_type:complete
LIHKFPITIYYEDTDAQGVVYYANYLRYFERARTEYLREIGYGQKKLMQEGVIFIVRKVNLEFMKPATLDDEIIIETELIKLGKVSFDFAQVVLCKGNLICESIIKCGSVETNDFKPKPLPKYLYNGMKTLLS